MFGLAKLIEYPDVQDPTMQGIELFDTFQEAQSRSEELINDFNENYGEDYSESASEKNPVAIASNGEVTWRGYIVEIQK
ncbi:hypothetical protein MSI_06980 [Treponema sp. JC4]|uniref:hypothetical protein n=1 Tax=Treponema sp. JC4 TaxID=1124982 RepID=UPI00025B04BF|nr:hypothetical protein [Treponema sp. JC4]EID86347.1 hypothetical protein MSI_06980 [Treponema sp. JC4]